MKICSKCKIEKEIGEFHKRTLAWDGLFSQCKVCRSEIAKQKYIKNKEHINKLNAKWKAENSEKHKEINARWRRENKERNQETGKALYIKNRKQVREKHKKWYEENTKERSETIKKWQIKNSDLVIIYRRKSYKKIMGTPKGRLNGSMSSNVGCSLRGNKQGRHWETLVGYSVSELKLHLEKLFLPGMDWDNYGAAWEIDHEIPKTAFNYEAAEDLDFKRCWNIGNLRPLWKSVNRHKYNKLILPFQPSLLLQEVSNG